MYVYIYIYICVYVYVYIYIYTYSLSRLQYMQVLGNICCILVASHDVWPVAPSAMVVI